MRRFAPVGCALAVQARRHANYDSVMRTHEEMRKKFNTVSSEVDELSLLQQTEELISRWKLNKWEFRVPPLLPPQKKEKVMLQLDILKALCIDQSKQLDAIANDVKLVSSLTGTSVKDVRGRNRAWLQDEAAKLRWRGEPNKAKALRDAFLRLEVYGSPDHRLLERFSCIYGMGMLGTFEDAFSHTIRADPTTGKLTMSEDNPFSELLGYIITRYPQFDIVYDFLGFNASNGYRASLCRFLSEGLEKKHGKEEARAQRGRILFNNPSSNEILFDFGDSKQSITVNDSVYGLPDLFHARGGYITLITIASSNHWLRSRQLPHRKQLEGIGRRASMVLGIPFDDVKVRNLLLPPNYIDKNSLLRLCEDVLDLSTEQQKEWIPWLSVYSKELDSGDVDYCELAKTVNEDEWLTL